MDFDQHASLERHIIELIDLAGEMARGRDEANQKIAELEDRLKSNAREMDKLKKERIEERETNMQRDRKHQDEKAQVALEMERLRTLNEELEAKCELFRTQNEAIQAARNQAQSQGSVPTSSSGAGQRLSHLVTKEIIDQVTEVHEYLKALEARATTVCTNAAQTELRITEMAKLAETSRDLLLRSQHELEATRASHREAISKSRVDAAKISALQLDVEGLQEQVNRLREEIAKLNHNRRTLELELERTKVTVATSILPLLEKEKHQASASLVSSEKSIAHNPGQSQSVADAAAATGCIAPMLTASQKEPTSLAITLESESSVGPEVRSCETADFQTTGQTLCPQGSVEPSASQPPLVLETNHLPQVDHKPLPDQAERAPIDPTSTITRDDVA